MKCLPMILMITSHVFQLKALHSPCCLPSGFLCANVEHGLSRCSAPTVQGRRSKADGLVEISV